MTPAPVEANPHQDLYIYYLSGRFRPGRDFKPNHFIGSWEEGDAEKFMDFTSDLVVSNIHYDVMKNLIRTPGFLKKKRFILSGLMRSEVARIESTLAELPVKIIRRWDQNGVWHTFYGASY